MSREPKKDLTQRVDDNLDSGAVKATPPRAFDLKATPPKWHELKGMPPRWRELGSSEWHEEDPHAKYDKRPYYRKNDPNYKQNKQ